MNRLSHEPLLHVRVRHGYFEPGRTRHLVFEPSEATQRLMNRFDVLMRCDGQSMVLHARADELEALCRECEQTGGILRFQLRSTDPACAQYTAPMQAGQEATFVPDPDHAMHLVCRTRVRADATPLGSGNVLGELLLPIEAMPAGQTRALAEGAWTLEIPARRAIWKYWLLGDWLDREPTLVDLAGQIEFAPPVSEALPDGRVATVIRSRTEIPLQERPPQRFQLRDARTTPSKVLVPRMPAATPGGLGREWQSGDTALIAEIFVSR